MKLKIPNTHELKTWPEYYAEVLNGNKTFELRKMDRDFKVGDELILREYFPSSQVYSGRECIKQISYILRGGTFGLEKDYCILGLRDNGL